VGSEVSVGVTIMGVSDATVVGGSVLPWHPLDKMKMSSDVVIKAVLKLNLRMEHTSHHFVSS
jgi:hypothetical protein